MEKVYKALPSLGQSWQRVFPKPKAVAPLKHRVTSFGLFRRRRVHNGSREGSEAEVAESAEPEVVEEVVEAPSDGTVQPYEFTPEQEVRFGRIQYVMGCASTYVFVHVCTEFSASSFVGILSV
eukprot:8677723-Pyramimonas_sp.AAC.1